MEPNITKSELKVHFVQIFTQNSYPLPVLTAKCYPFYLGFLKFKKKLKLKLVVAQQLGPLDLN